MLEDILNEAVSVTHTKKTNSENPDVIHIASDKELLEDFLNGLDLNDDTVVSIEDVEPEIKLDKYLWVIRQKEIELNKCSALAEESMRRTQAWLNKKENTITSAIEFLSGQMKNYLKQNKLKSLSLPNGNIGFRKQSDVVIIQNEEIFLENAKPELLRHVEESYEPDLKAIKDYIKKSGGDLPIGIDLKPQESKFYYKLSEDSN
ncbi:MAG: host-nuclease inhibitor Gam family protein [Ignavibacteria bacterium]|nr:host-nuclease inhibitor Gam family protein [Ignavibacteria bacterium]